MATAVRIVETADVVTLEAPPLTLAFRWDGHRWAHHLDLDGRTIAATVEWDPGQGDPARVVSPAYQQLSTQDRPEGAQALLVGQWGPHHFSAVFTVATRGAGIAVDVDVAALSRSPLEILASTYLVDRASGDLVDAGPRAIEWRGGVDADAGGRLRFESIGDSSRVGLAEAGRRATRVQATREAASTPGERSQRLQYRWCWHSNLNQAMVNHP